MGDGAPLRFLDILSAMFVPVVLISACAALAQVTAIRHQNVMTRLRSLSEDSIDLLREAPTDADRQARQRAFITHQLSLLAGRAVMLQRAMALVTTAIGFFIATSIAIGVIFIVFPEPQTAWNGVPLVLGLLGALLVFAGSVDLIREGRMATHLTVTEVEFLHNELHLDLPKDQMDVLADRLGSAIGAGGRSLRRRRPDDRLD